MGGKEGLQATETALERQGERILCRARSGRLAGTLLAHTLRHHRRHEIAHGLQLFPGLRGRKRERILKTALAGPSQNCFPSRVRL